MGPGGVPIPGLAGAPPRPVVMGILNVTRDSFSDGGRFAGSAEAVAHGLALHASGADVVDVGGESTRPGAERTDAAEELARVLPVVGELTERGVAVSVDTMRAEVAQRCLDAGAVMVNDVSGGLADPSMLDTVAAAGAAYVAMHWRAHSATMADQAAYADVVGEVCEELAARRDAALAAGVRADRLVLDPGLGFAKEADHNWALLARLDALVALGHPVLVGASRKRFLGSALADAAGTPRPVGQREVATAALSALVVDRGAWGVRVHDAAASRDALAVASRARRPDRREWP